MAEQYGFSKPPKQYTGILIQQIPGSSYSILQYTANPVSNHRPMVPTDVNLLVLAGRLMIINSA